MAAVIWRCGGHSEGSPRPSLCATPAGSRPTGKAKKTIDSCCRAVQRITGFFDFHFAAPPERTLQILRRFWQTHGNPRFLPPNSSRNGASLRTVTPSMARGAAQAAMIMARSNSGIHKPLTATKVFRTPWWLTAKSRSRQ